jgi:hypothetical protein
MVRPDVKQDYTLYGAVPATVSLRRIKVCKATLGARLQTADHHEVVSSGSLTVLR